MNSKSLQILSFVVLILFSVAVFSVFAFDTAALAGSSSTKTKTYENKYYSLEIPEKWEVEESENDQFVRVLSNTSSQRYYIQYSDSSIPFDVSEGEYGRQVISVNGLYQAEQIFNASDGTDSIWLLIRNIGPERKNLFIMTASNFQDLLKDPVLQSLKLKEKVVDPINYSALWLTKNLDAGKFRIKSPSKWKFSRGQGIDSYVGNFSADGISLDFDYGWYSNDLSDFDSKFYKTEYIEVDGKPAKLVSARDNAVIGYAGLYVDNLSDSDKLMISANGLTEDQQKLVVRMLKTVDFPPYGNNTFVGRVNGLWVRVVDVWEDVVEFIARGFSGE